MKKNIIVGSVIFFCPHDKIVYDLRISSPLSKSRAWLVVDRMLKQGADLPLFVGWHTPFVTPFIDAL